MIGNKPQRSSNVFKIPGYINFSSRLRNLLQESGVILKTSGDIQAIFQVVGESLAVNILAKGQSIHHAESETCCWSMLQRHHLCSSISFDFCSQPFRIFGESD